MFTRRRPGPVANGAPSQNNVVCSAMKSGFTTRRAQTYIALSQPSFNIFSSRVEGIHNTVHNIIGGSSPIGHMTTVDVAAFDPIFWLHHANVDRLTAMYQATHPYEYYGPGAYLTPGYAMATFARIVPGIDGPLDNLATNLYPFKHPNGAYFKSDEIKTASSIWTYNYGYDEVPCTYASKSVLALKLYTQKRINALYGPDIILGPFLHGICKSPLEFPRSPVSIRLIHQSYGFELTKMYPKSTTSSETISPSGLSSTRANSPAHGHSTAS